VNDERYTCVFCDAGFETVDQALKHENQDHGMPEQLKMPERGIQ